MTLGGGNTVGVWDGLDGFSQARKAIHLAMEGLLRRLLEDDVRLDVETVDATDGVAVVNVLGIDGFGTCGATVENGKDGIHGRGLLNEVGQVVVSIT